jgi:RNA polymerase subunit RPABC4/transcription elongation factor Spt4
MKTLDELWKDIELTVCRICVDNAHGVCTLPCALKANFAAVVSAVSATHSDTYGPYVQALRTVVCTSCDRLLDEGRCPTRDRVECALDRYYPLVIDEIESSQLAPLVGAR